MIKKSNKKPISIQNIPILLIVVLGFFLRIYQIGKDSFWLDEVGVASVIFAESIDNFINIVRSHVAAVPLDYVITWALGQISLNEGWLRFPSAIWGTFTLVICYMLFKQFANRNVALVGVLLLALSPLHIKYSQELRFYSSLIFFYVLSTKLIFDAIQFNKLKNWIIFTIVTCIGTFFHIFVGFSVVNGFFWFFSKDFKVTNKKFRHFLFSLIVIFIGEVTAYYLFVGYTSKLNEPLTRFESVFQAFGTGLGWLPITSNNTVVEYLWGACCLVFTIFGVIILTKNNKFNYIKKLLLSVFLQIIIIFIFVIIRGYFIRARHFVFLLPFIFLFVAIGIMGFLKKNRFGKISSYIIVLVICLLSLPQLLFFYDENKGFAREIAAFVNKDWETGDLVIFTEQFSISEPVKYYLVDVMGNKQVLPYLWTANLDTDLQTVLNWGDETIYIIGDTSFDQKKLLYENGFFVTEIENVWQR